MAISYPPGVKFIRFLSFSLPAQKLSKNIMPRHVATCITHLACQRQVECEYATEP